MAFPAAVSQVLARINKITPVSTDDWDGTGEWIYLESEELWDADLLAKLRRNWGVITGPFAHHFALVYCHDEPESGIWLHYLSSYEQRSEYACGCHQVSSWS